MTGGTHPGTGGPAASAVERQDSLIGIIKLADENYRRRGELTGKSAWAEKLDCWPDAGNSYEVQWRLSRALFLDGEQSPELYATGALHGLRAVKINRGSVEGHFWTGVNLALYAQARKGPKGAVALLKSRGELHRACAISEAYHGAGPLRVLGRLEHKSPRLLGGSLARSLSYYERALAIAPANTVTLVYAAELAIDRREYEQAASLLERAIRLPIDPDWEFENIRDKTQAELMLRRLRTGVGGES
jgi:tetratricopeptide (TPR) repeat protein